MKRFFLLFFMGFLLFSPASSFSATYYVDGINGDDLNDGTGLTSAWKTVSKSADTMLSGDTVYVSTGVYKESVVPKNSSTTYKAIGRTVLSGDTNDDGYSDLFYGFRLMNISGTKIQGFLIEKHQNVGILGENVPSTIISSNVLSGNGSDNINLYNADNSLVESNICSNGGNGINISSSTVILRYNVVYGNTATGIVLGGQNNQVYNNTIYANEWIGLDIWNGDGNIVRNNIIVKNWSGISGMPAVVLDYNNLWGNTEGDESYLSWGPHNISQDPLFVDTAAGDFRLKAGSPCLGTGAGGANIGAYPGGFIAPDYISYYVSPVGTDAPGYGTQTAPWKTIGYAARNALPWSIINVSSGIYREESVVPRTSFTTYKAIGRAILSGDTNDDGSPDLYYGFRLTNISGTKIQGFLIEKYQSRGIYGENIASTIISGNVLSGNGSDNIYLYNADNSLIEANICSNSSGHGINISSSTSLTLRYNLVYGNNNVGIGLEGENSQIYNNTIYANEWAGLDVYGDGTAVTNNIIVKNGVGVLGLPGIFDYNDLWGHTEISGDEGYLALGPYNISQDPLFVDAAAGDFRLKAGSPCLGTGAGGANIGAYPGGFIAPDYISYYVSPVGTDAPGYGTQTAPWKTIGYAARNALPWSIINVSSGIYKESVIPGTSFTTYKAIGRAVLSGDTNDDGSPDLYNGFRLMNISGTKIQGFLIEKYQNEGIFGENVPSTVISSNVLSGNLSDNIDLYNADNSLIESNICSNGGNGIYISSSTSLTLRYNLVYGNTNVGIVLGGEKSQIYNNTIYANKWVGLDVYDYGNAITNNIITKNGYANMWGAVDIFDYNDLWGNTETNWDEDYLALGPYNISQDPLFVYPSTDPAKADFRLSTGSPCIGTGEGGVNIGYYLGSGVSVDTTPPRVITDLTVRPGPRRGEITLKWTSPGDDGLIGIISTGTFEIHYASYSPIAPNMITISTHNVVPQSTQTYIISGLPDSTEYFIKIRTADEVPNWSGFSPEASAKTFSICASTDAFLTVYSTYTGLTIIKDPEIAPQVKFEFFEDGFTPPTSFYFIGPSSTTFDPPALISFNYSVTLSTISYSPTGLPGTWNLLPTFDYNGKASAYIQHLSYFVLVKPLPPFIWADIDFVPDTLNLKSQGKWITAYIELPGYDLNNIDPESIKILWLNYYEVLPPIYAQTKPISIGDYDNDGIPDLMVKFDRQSVADFIDQNIGAGNVLVNAEMNLKDGTRIRAKDTIRVIKPGRAEIVSKLGGKIISPKNAQIEIPENAIATETLIEIKNVAANFSLRNEKAINRKMVGNVFEFGPDGIKFNKPVKITLPYDDTMVNDINNLYVSWWNPELNDWEKLLNSRVDKINKKVTAETEHFSNYAVIEWTTGGVVISSDTVNNPPDDLWIASYLNANLAVPDNNGGIYFVWIASGFGHSDIRVQRLDNNGNKAWPGDGIILSTTNYNVAIFHVISDGQGGILVVWNDNSLYSLLGARINEQGNILWRKVIDNVWGLGCVACSGGRIAVALDSLDKAVIVWEDWREDQLRSDIFAQRIDINTGNTLWTPGGVPIIKEYMNFQRFPEIVNAGPGTSIITWCDDNKNKTYAQKINSQGQLLWPETGVEFVYGRNNPFYRFIISDNDDGAILSYVSVGGIYAQRLDKEGIKKWGDSQIYISTVIPGGFDLTPDGFGGVIIAWSEKRYNDSDIFAQRIDHAGNIKWQEYGVFVCTAPYNQGYSIWGSTRANPRVLSEVSVISDGLGGAFIVWRDSRNVTSSDIYGQYIDANGNPKWTPNGIIISTAPGQQWAPAGITRTSDGKIAVVWFDDRNGNWDIYAQKFYNQGPHRFAVSGLPQSIAVGISTNVSVEMRDLSGQRITDYTGVVGFYSDDPNAILPSSYTFQFVDSGSKTFSVEFKTPGTRLLKVYDINEPYLVGYATINVVGMVPISVAIKVPHDGKRVSGNRVTIMADLTSGNIFDVAKITLQYKQVFSDTWQNIPAADSNNPNPDLNHPYFTHWDVSASSDNSYHIRAMAEDRTGRYTLSQPITVYVDKINFDIEEKNVGLILQKRQKVFNDKENIIISADTKSNTHIEVKIATGAVSANTVLKVENDVISPPGTGYFEKIKIFSINLESGQSELSGSVPTEITISYPDTDDNGIVDGTIIKEETLAIFSYNSQPGTWERNNTSRTDRTKKLCTASVTHFSVYGLFAGAAGSLDDILVYPNPYVPNDADTDNGRPYSATDPATGIIFENLTDAVDLKIYTASGGLVLDRRIAATGGIFRWDGRNGDGREVASGIYLAVVKSAVTGQKVVKRVAVVR